MATVMNPHTSGHLVVDRTAPQKVCIGLGIAFILIGLVGVMMPGFMGMHLSLVHNLIHIGSGALSLWAGYSDSTNKAVTFCITFGAIYGLLGIAGFVIGEPGYPGVGHMEADQNLFRVIPNVLEFGTLDHIVHILIAAVFLVAGLSYRTKTQTAFDSDVNRVGINRRTTLGSSDYDTKSGTKL